jgi:hypothetical protein
MPHFFFNYTSQGATCVDLVGAEFFSLEAAYLDTCKAALAIAFEKLGARQDPTNDMFEIMDDQQNVLMEVPFSEVLRPAAATTNIATNGQQIILALQNCRCQVERSKRLKDEIRAEFARARGMFHAIRANLSTSPHV